MLTRLALTLASVITFAIALPLSVGAVSLVEAPGASAGSAGLTGVSPTTGPATSPTGSAPDGNGAAASNWSGQYSMFRPRTHSVQKTNWYCVPTTIQMMLNLINGESDRSGANQTKYWRYAQDHSRYPTTDNGADAAGWVAALRHWGAGNYTVGVHATRQAALRAAAKRMRETGKPVGLMVWGRGGTGGHAWVMTGFKSTADPKVTANYTVSSVQAMGSLWPYGTINGKPYDPGPREWVESGELRRKFTRYEKHNQAAWNGRWLTVLP